MGVSFLDLFAGCGGLSEGFRGEGFESQAAIEWDTAAAATYAQNFGNHVFCGDIVDVDAGSLQDVDLVVGGPPCQGFSQLGNRDFNDPRNILWKEYARIVRAVHPSVFLLENVPQFLKSGQFEMMAGWTERGGPLAGYRLTYDVLNAADYGVPQRRRRAIVIGSRVGEPSLPWPTHGETAGEPWTTVRSALEGVPYDCGSPNLPEGFVASGLPGPFKAPELHLARRPEPISLLRYDAVPPGGNRFDLPRDLMPECWRNKATGTTDVMGRLEWDKPSLTIRTEFFKPEKGRYLHPQWDPVNPSKRVNRPITHWEAARLQTFSDDFVWCGSKIEIAKQIGNAVPVLLAAALARHIRDTLLA